MSNGCVKLYDKQGRLITGSAAEENEHLIIDENLRIPDVPIPEPLTHFFSYRANHHLIPRFVKIVAYSIKHSFSHPDSRVRGPITRDEVQHRLEMCYAIALVGYKEMGLTIFQIMDTMPATLVDAIREGVPVTQRLSRRTPDKWSVDEVDEPLRIVQEDINSSSAASEEVEPSDIIADTDV